MLYTYFRFILFESLRIIASYCFFYQRTSCYTFKLLYKIYNISFYRALESLNSITYNMYVQIMHNYLPFYRKAVAQRHQATMECLK